MFLTKPRKKISRAKLLGAVQINNTSFFVCKNNEGTVCLKTGREEKRKKRGIWGKKKGKAGGRQGRWKDKPP